MYNCFKSSFVLPDDLPSVVLGEQIIPKNYISSDIERVSLYNLISNCVDLKELDKIYSFMLSKFGRCPSQCLCLFNSKKTSIRLYDKNISDIFCFNNIVRIVFIHKKGFVFSSFIKSFNCFFSQQDFSYRLLKEGKNIKIQFKHNHKDVYILIQKFLKVLYD